MQTAALAAAPPSPSKIRVAVPVRPLTTPLIDVSVLLLVFFLLTCHFRQPGEGVLPGSLPRAGYSGPGPDIFVRPVVVSVRPAGRGQAAFELEGHPQALRSAGDLFRALAERRSILSEEAWDVPVIIRPSAEAPWRWAVEAYNQAQRAGFENVGWGCSS